MLKQKGTKTALRKTLNEMSFFDNVVLHRCILSICKLYTLNPRIFVAYVSITVYSADDENIGLNESMKRRHTHLTVTELELRLCE